MPPKIVSPDGATAATSGYRRPLPGDPPEVAMQRYLPPVAPRGNTFVPNEAPRAFPPQAAPQPVDDLAAREAQIEAQIAELQAVLAEIKRRRGPAKAPSNRAKKP